MEATFWMAIIARDALIDGDLVAVRSVAHELAAHDYGDAFPPSWKHWVGQMQKRAGELAVAADDDEAGQAVGALAVACGNCHSEQKGGFRLPFAEPMHWRNPPETITERMERHSVGIEQMWFGLIAPSDDAWRAGTITLTRAPLEVPLDGDRLVDETVHAEVERLRDIANQARLAGTYSDRARLYGMAITACAHCHYGTTYIDP
jgi:cytochrome c553